VLTDDIGMEAINRLHLSRNGTTDVISFGYRPMPGEGDRPTGEIFVNIQRAVERGTSRKTWGASKELALYIAHGFDHLTGGRDHTALRRAKMRRTELRWLEKAETLGLTSDLIC
jgi:rRNA maturation RNase YbeY